MFKRKLYLIMSYVLIATLAAALSGCTTLYNPATGQKETYFISTAQEMAIGENVEKEVLETYKVSGDKKKQDYVDQIGQKVASVSDRQDLDYKFVVLDDKELNAFTIPGGIVYINTGLLDILNDDEVAAVLAHEIGHVAARHSIKRIQSQLGYQLLLTVAVVSVNKNDPNAAKTVAQGSNAIFELVQLGYSRRDELLADRLSIKYTYKAGYNPWGMVEALKKLQAHSEEKGGWGGPVILRSHPYIEDRIRAGIAEVGNLPETKL
ncbi:MAG: M48 family metalloprotease [Candidatus Omnitrophica bacterium]|nr:M48 family metalloprotease [Candidatus Omnitrophota bacterium]